MAEQHGHFGVGHFLDVAAEIMAERSIRGNRIDIACDGVRNRKRQVFGVVAHHQRPLAGFRLPFVAGNVEVTEGVTVEIDVHALAFVCGKRNLGEALELAIRTQHTSLRTAHVQLYNGRTGNIGIVADHHVNAVLTSSGGTVGERGVAQAVTEREAHGHTGGLVITVANERAFAIDRIATNRRIPTGARAILVMHRPGFSQVAGRIDLTGQRAHGRGSAGLTRQTHVKHCGNVVNPRQFHRRAGDKHDHDRLARALQRFDQIVLHLRNRHGGTVKAFGFAAFVKTDDCKHHINAFLASQRDCVFHEHAVSLALAVIALLIAGKHEAFGVLDLFKNVLFLGGVHLGGAGTLITCGCGHIADHRHAGAGLEWQGRVIVLQQHTGAFGHLACHVVMRCCDIVFEQIVTSNTDQLGRCRDFCDFCGTRVDIGFRQGSRLDRAFQLTHGSEARRRHFQRSACLDCCDRGVGSAPVGDDHAVEAPFVAQNLLEQMLVFVRVDAVDLVVGGHDGQRLGFTHCDFETGQIQFAHGTLIDHGVAGLAAQFLAVDREMLRACGDAVALDAADQACRHTSGDDRIFGIVFEVTSAQRVALDVQTRAEQHVHVKIVRFVAEGLAHFFGERRIPRIGHGSCGREAGGRLGCADAEMIAFAELAAHAVGAVAHHEAGDVCAVVASRIPFGSTGKHCGLFNDRKFFEFHWFSLALTPRTRLALPEPALFLLRMFLAASHVSIRR